MAMLSKMIGDCLVVRSVGDHDLELGFSQMLEAMEKARAHFEASGKRPVMYLDMLESEEDRDASEIRHINDFFKQFLDFLDGRIAVMVDKQLYFGLARVFSALAETSGLDVRPFYEGKEALAFIGVTDLDLSGGV